VASGLLAEAERLLAETEERWADQPIEGEHPYLYRQTIYLNPTVPDVMESPT
jgi:hypothetical protein